MQQCEILLVGRIEMRRSLRRSRAPLGPSVTIEKLASTRSTTCHVKGVAMNCAPPLASLRHRLRGRSGGGEPRLTRFHAASVRVAIAFAMSRLVAEPLMSQTPRTTESSAFSLAFNFAAFPLSRE